MSTLFYSHAELRLDGQNAQKTYRSNLENERQQEYDAFMGRLQMQSGWLFSVGF